MTRIDFYHNAAQRLEAAARIVHKAYRQGLSTVVYAPRLAEEIDRLLWTMPPGGFLPHCSYDAPLADQTPVLIARDLPVGESPRHDLLLVNLDDEVPPCFSRFQRVVEVVGRDEADRATGRARFRHYRDRGYEVGAHDLGGDNP